MSEVTRILSAIEQGDPTATEQLLPLVYNELRKLAAQKLAAERPGQTLQSDMVCRSSRANFTSSDIDPRRLTIYNSSCVPGRTPSAERAEPTWTVSGT
jgi:hypothetical protein